MQAEGWISLKKLLPLPLLMELPVRAPFRRRCSSTISITSRLVFPYPIEYVLLEEGDLQA